MNLRIMCSFYAMCNLIVEYILTTIGIFLISLILFLKEPGVFFDGNRQTILIKFIDTTT